MAATDNLYSMKKIQQHAVEFELGMFVGGQGDEEVEEDPIDCPL